MRACQQQNKPHPSALKSLRKRGRRNAKVAAGRMGVMAAIAAATAPAMAAADLAVVEFAAVQLE